MLDSNDIEILQGMFTKSENAVLNELDKVQDKLQEQIDKLRQDVKENNQISVLLSIIEDLRRRIEELERKSA